MMPKMSDFGCLIFVGKIPKRLRQNVQYVVQAKPLETNLKKAYISANILSEAPLKWLKFVPK